MTVEELIKQYEEELHFCDDCQKHNAKHECYNLAERWRIRKDVIRGFITDLKKLLV